MSSRKKIKELPRQTTLQDLNSLWCEKLDFIVQYLSPHDMFNFAKTEKTNLSHVKNHLLRVKKKYEEKTYGFKIGGESNNQISFDLPHKKCLMRVWARQGRSCHPFMFTGSDHSDPFSSDFFDGPHYQFASQALMHIVSIKQDSEFRIRATGWCLSGEGVYMMKNKKTNRSYFRPYPMWTFINPRNFGRFKFIPFR